MIGDNTKKARAEGFFAQQEHTFGRSVFRLSGVGAKTGAARRSFVKATLEGPMPNCKAESQRIGLNKDKEKRKQRHANKTVKNFLGRIRRAISLACDKRPKKDPLNGTSSGWFQP